MLIWQVVLNPVNCTVDVDLHRDPAGAGTAVLATDIDIAGLALPPFQPRPMVAQEARILLNAQETLNLSDKPIWSLFSFIPLFKKTVIHRYCYAVR